MSTQEAPPMSGNLRAVRRYADGLERQLADEREGREAAVAAARLEAERAAERERAGREAAERALASERADRDRERVIGAFTDAGLIPTDKLLAGYDEDGRPPDVATWARETYGIGPEVAEPEPEPVRPSFPEPVTLGSPSPPPSRFMGRSQYEALRQDKRRGVDVMRARQSGALIVVEDDDPRARTPGAGLGGL